MLDLLDGAYRELTGEFTARGPLAASFTWYKPDQTVGFWIRRMAQETLIHRVDAEQAAGVPLAPIPADLAVDGVDEVLERFLGYGSEVWRDQFGSLPATPLDPVLVATGDCAWLVRARPDGVSVTPGRPGDETGAGRPGGGRTPGDTPAGATVSGEPVPMLLWLWRRGHDGVLVDGDAAVAERLRVLMGDATR